MMLFCIIHSRVLPTTEVITAVTNTLLLQPLLLLTFDRNDHYAGLPYAIHGTTMLLLILHLVATNQ